AAEYKAEDGESEDGPRERYRTHQDRCDRREDCGETLIGLRAKSSNRCEDTVDNQPRAEQERCNHWPNAWEQAPECCKRGSEKHDEAEGDCANGEGALSHRLEVIGKRAQPSELRL